MNSVIETYENNLLAFVNATVPNQNEALSVRGSMQFLFIYQLYR